MNANDLQQIEAASDLDEIPAGKVHTWLFNELPNIHQQRDDAAATIENIASLIGPLARDLPPGDRFPEVWAIVDLIEMWRERALERGE